LILRRLPGAGYRVEKKIYEERNIFPRCGDQMTAFAIVASVNRNGSDLILA
jgi:hypothetical protein